MTSFSADWLKLRETADARARNASIADAVAARFALRDQLTIVDLGAGSGANLRAAAPLLPSRQNWLLADNDPDLLQTAKKELAIWANANEPTPAGGLRLEKDRLHIDVDFLSVDLATDTASLFKSKPDLVTASALFDLTSETYIRTLVKMIVSARACFYAVLTYNGQHRWTPHRPADNRMSAAFHRHQMRDKGFGPAAGPLASSILADQFKLHGYLVQEGDSAWRLDQSERMLLNEVVRGYALAAREAGGIDDKTIVDWVNVTRNSAAVGHTDIFAVPA